MQIFHDQKRRHLRRHGLHQGEENVQGAGAASYR